MGKLDFNHWLVALSILTSEMFLLRRGFAAIAQCLIKLFGLSIIHDICMERICLDALNNYHFGICIIFKLSLYGVRAIPSKHIHLN